GPRNSVAPQFRGNAATNPRKNAIAPAEIAQAWSAALGAAKRLRAPGSGRDPPSGSAARRPAGELFGGASTRRAQPGYLYPVGRPLTASTACVLCGAALLALALRERQPSPLEASKGLAPAVHRALAAGDEETDSASCDQNSLDRGLTMPTGEPTTL